MGLHEAQLAASQAELNLINGVELSCAWNHQLLHVVGLNIDPTNQALLAGIKQNRERRFKRADAMFDDLEKHDIHIRNQVHALIHSGGAPTRPHFAQALVEQGYAKDKKQAFKRYLVPNKPGFIAVQWPAIEEVGEWIKAAGGIAVLAHPIRYKFTRSKLIRLICDMQAANVHGMEITTPITSNEQSSMLSQLAIEHHLLASTGSDFHSNDQPWAKLGGARPLPAGLTPVWSQF